MTDSSWWKLTFLRRQKSQPKVQYEVPAEFGSGDAHSEVEGHDSPLDARLERIVDKSTPAKGRHVKVSHSGRFKEKKKVRVTLAEKPEMFTARGSGEDRTHTNSKIKDKCTPGDDDTAT